MANVGGHTDACLSHSCYCFERSCALPRPNDLRRRSLPECPVFSRRQTAHPIKCPCKTCLRRKARRSNHADSSPKSICPLAVLLGLDRTVRAIYFIVSP